MDQRAYLMVLLAHDCI